MINKLKTIKYFTQVSIDKGEYIFQHSKHNENIYVILNGEVSIEIPQKSSNKNKKLATVKNGDIIGEGALFKRYKKQISAKTITEVIALVITPIDLNKFIQNEPKLAIEFMETIIDQTNVRLIEANKVINNIDSITYEINNLNSINLVCFFHLLEKIKSSLDLKRILFIQKHKVLDNFYQLKYSTDKTKMLLDEVIEAEGGKTFDINMVSNHLQKNDLNSLYEISIGTNIYGYLIISIDKEDPQCNLVDKVISSITNSLAGVLKLILEYDEIRAKELKY